VTETTGKRAIMADQYEDRIQPCLFDWLIDENPGSKIDSRTDRAISVKRYREGVLRDIAWLLNSSRHVESEEITEFGEVSRSVLNFGIPDFCGRISATLELGEIEREIAEAITRFEPRIIPKTLSVRARAEATVFGPNLIAFEIRGELWASPVPEQLYIKTQIDLETGQCVF
jgi:type VI secretion system protein ImpF